jgi:hypothetical protein
MLLGNIDEALFELLLVLHVYDGLVLQLIQLLFIGFALASVFLVYFLLLIKKVTPLVLNTFEIS